MIEIPTVNRFYSPIVRQMLYGTSEPSTVIVYTPIAEHTHIHTATLLAGIEKHQQHIQFIQSWNWLMCAVCVVRHSQLHANRSIPTIEVHHFFFPHRYYSLSLSLRLASVGYAFAKSALTVIGTHSERSHRGESSSTNTIKRETNIRKKRSSLVFFSLLLLCFRQYHTHIFCFFGCVSFRRSKNNKKKKTEFAEINYQSRIGESKLVKCSTKMCVNNKRNVLPKVCVRVCCVQMYKV